MSVMSDSVVALPAPNAGHFPHLSTGIFPRDEKAGEGHKTFMLTGGTTTSLDAVLARLDRRLADMGMSDREASLAAVGKPDLIRDMRRGKGIPRGDRLAALARILGTTTDWLLSGGPEGEPERRAALALERLRSEVGGATLLSSHSSRGDLNQRPQPLAPLPLLGTALAGDIDMPEASLELIEVNMTDVLAYLERPPSLASDRDAYALTILSDSMFPRLSPGERVAVSPRAPVSIGDDVVVQLRGPRADNDDPEADRVRTVLAKRLVRRTASYVELRQFHPEQTFRIQSERIAAIHKISGIMF